MAKVTCEALVEGGKASAGPPIAPVLGPTGVNLYSVVTRINELTEDLKGLKVPVTIVVDDDTKEFEITVGLPPTSALNQVKSVLGTCVSMGVTIDGKDARTVQQEIDQGLHDEKLQA